MEGRGDRMGETEGRRRLGWNLGPLGTQVRAMVMGLLKTKRERKKELKVFSPVLT